MKAIFRVNSATPFAVSAVRYLCTVHFDSCIRIALAAGFGLLVSFAACADSVTTNKYFQALHQAYGGDNDAGNGYTAALWKLNGEGDPVSPVKGESGCFNEYVAALGWGRWGLVRSLGSGSNSFTGDGLTIGSSDKDGTFMLRYGGNTLTVDYLTLVRGLITSGSGGETLSSQNPIVVRSTTTSPFYFSIGNGRSITIDGPLSSEDDSALVVINRYSLEDKAENDGELKGGTIYFNRDNSAYKGKVKVDYLTTYNKGYTGTDSNTNIVLNVNSNDALGGTPAAAMPDALTLANGGTLAVGYATSSEAPFAPGGGLRGLTVSNGGRVSSSSALYFAMPVTSSDGSTLRFDCPNQTVALSSSFSGSASVELVNGSKLLLAEGFDWKSAGSIKLNGQTLELGTSITGVNFEISGVVTINNGNYAVDLSSATFAEGAMIKRGGTGAITLPDGVDCFVPTYSASCQEAWNVSKSRWTGLNEDNSARWDVEGNWDSKIPIWGMDLNNGQYGQYPWYWAIFKLNSSTAIELGSPVAFSTETQEYTRDTAAYCLVVEAGSKQLTINKSNDSGAVSTLKYFPAGSGYTSFANYSAYPVIYNVRVSLEGASRGGASGVLPYAIYNEDFNFGRNTTLAFFAGEASLSEEHNTSTFNGAISAPDADISIEANHIVVAKGPLNTKNVTVSGKLIVDGGTVNVASLATAASGVIILKGATVNAATLPSGTTIGAGLTTLNYGDADITLGTIAFDEGGVLKLSGTGTVTLSDSTVVPAGTLLVGSGATLSYTGGDLDLNYPVHSVGAGTLTVSLDSGRSITLSSAVSGSVSLDCTGASSLSFGNGFEWTSTGTLTLPNGTVVQGPFTWMKSGAGWGGDFTLAEHWSDNADIESGSSKTYLDYGYTARTVNYADNNYEYVFPSAATLVLAGKSSSYASLEPKARKITIDHLLMGEYSQFKFSGGGVYSNGDEELYGNVTVASSESAPAKFLSGDGRHDKVFAQISGSGKIIFEHYGNSGKVTLSGDNSGYKGALEIDADTTVCVAESKNLGGNPSAQLARGLVLTNGSTVEFTAAFNVNQDNRGLYVDGDGTVTNSALVVWFGPLSFSDGATLTKEGDGELVILGSCSAGRVLLKGLGRAIKFKTAYADIVKVESGLPGYRVVVTAEDDYNAYKLEKVRGLNVIIY